MIDHPTPPTIGNDLDQHQILRIVQDFHLLRRQREDAYDELKRAYHITLTKLALAAEYKDGDTGTHIVRIGALSGLLARNMGMPADWSERIEQAAPMHDIGKIGIPDGILKKPDGLTVEERKIMETHPVIGAQILGNTNVPVLQMAAEIALGHHERWDGQGYPNRLKGDAIPQSARIVTAIDFFDALTMDRCYRKALPDDTAKEMLCRGRGSHFDPAVVDALVASLPQLTALRDAINRGEWVSHHLQSASSFVRAH
ncbi:metal-dependent phosphohydrolase [Thauera sp. 27]|uniref:HD-GYP domain-containing protein n=1 Tax=Thauera sp. 27 TaxID=305700 RepID=UPI0002D09299|nr:HD domain-containing phosphohydrolase [Thauera sp. 27]ENO82310.1 metal-dependent phosphohydrolase [Thauera sp. 27]